MRRLLWASFLALLVPTHLYASAIVFSASGPNAASIQAQVDAYRLALGTLNPNVPGSFGSGRREINWDGVPDAFASPNNLPPDFFNVISPRGVVFQTPGSGFRVSADDSNPTATPVQFGEIDPNYPSFFEPFSPQRLFTALGSTITDVHFFVPGTNIPASTRGFGSIFSDVDLPNITSLTYFDLSNNSLGTFFVPAVSGNQTFSFLGVLFDAGEQIGHVRITSGNQVLSPGNVLLDLVVMDDFIYGEPTAVPTQVPEPATSLLIAAGFGLLGGYRFRRSRDR